MLTGKGNEYVFLGKYRPLSYIQGKQIRKRSPLIKFFEDRNFVLFTVFLSLSRVHGIVNAQQMFVGCMNVFQTTPFSNYPKDKTTGPAFRRLGVQCCNTKSWLASWRSLNSNSHSIEWVCHEIPAVLFQQMTVKWGGVFMIDF